VRHVIRLCLILLLGCGATREPVNVASVDEPVAEEPRVWRAFSDTSPWNTPIADASVHPESEALIEALATSSQWAWLGVNIHPWSVPLYMAGDATELADVHARLSNEGEQVTLRWPVPRGAEGAPEADGHLAIVDLAGGRAYDFFQARPRGDGSWDCTLCASIDLRGDGVRPPQEGPRPWWESHGARACGFPLVAGLVRPDELAAGRIDHALVIAYPGIRQRFFVPPASTGHPANGRIAEDRGIPCGGRVQLDPDYDVSALSPHGQVIARALQEYGAYVGDYSDSINVYADGSTSARAAYGDTLTSETLRAIDLRQLRALTWGPLSPPARAP
jgi:hypothetical protein